MDIDDAASEVVGNEDMFQKSRHHNKLGADLAARSKHRFSVRFIGIVFRLENDTRLDPRLFSDLDTANLGGAADDEPDVDRQRAIFDLLQQIFESAAAAR